MIEESNKTSRYKKDSGIQLLDLLSSAKTSGRLQVEVPQQNNPPLKGGNYGSKVFAI